MAMAARMLQRAKAAGYIIAAIDASSSCGPHENDHPPPPTAQAPNPTVVSVNPLLPNDLVGSVIASMISLRLL